MKIEHLAEHLAVIPTLASWLHSEWGHLSPQVAFDDLVARLEKQATPNKIPQTFVALEDETPVGTASLIENDMSTQKELSPWLASVYVVPEFRNRGIGSKLVRVAIQEAKHLGTSRLYLLTPDKIKFYSNLGWRILRCAEYRGENVTIMWYNTEP